MKDFIRGIGSAINLFPTDRNIIFSSKYSETDALRSDWEKVGKDMRLAVEKNNNQGIKKNPYEQHITK